MNPRLASRRVTVHWYDPMSLFIGRRVGGTMAVGDSHFGLIGTYSARGELTLALHFLSPCCGASMRARIPGSECSDCETRYSIDSLVLRLDRLDNEALEDLELWLDLCGWSPLEAALACGSLEDLYRTELEPAVLSRIGPCVQLG